MIKLLQFLFTGSWHEHIYEVFEELNLHPKDITKYGGLPYGKIIVSRCKCGKIKQDRITT